MFAKIVGPNVLENLGGYRTGRAAFGVGEGASYFEVTVPESGAVRVGWSTERGDPVNVFRFSGFWHVRFAQSRVPELVTINGSTGCVLLMGRFFTNLVDVRLDPLLLLETRLEREAVGFIRVCCLMIGLGTFSCRTAQRMARRSDLPRSIRPSLWRKSWKTRKHAGWFVSCPDPTIHFLRQKCFLLRVLDRLLHSSRCFVMCFCFSFSFLNLSDKERKLLGNSFL